MNYGYRNWFGKGGLREDAEFEQWTDLQAGVNLGVKVGKNIGVFAEGEYMKYWDREIFEIKAGINYQFR